MRVLVVGTLPGAVERAGEVLRAHGHDVLHCRAPRGQVFPCIGLAERGRCRFEGAPVDVVVTARDRPWPRPSPLEDGAICAIRRLVPLVVHGTTVLEPFERWAVAETSTDEELLAAVERAPTAPLPEHGRLATATMRALLASHGLGDEGSHVEVSRRGGRLVVRLALAPGAEPHAGALTVKLLAALRALDPYAEGIDVVRA